MVNQICVTGLIQGLAEGLHFARAAGLDAEKVIEVISLGAAQSWLMENRSKTMLVGEYDHGFAVDLMRKELAIILNEASLSGAQLPVTELVNHFYAKVEKMGGHPLEWLAEPIMNKVSFLGLGVMGFSMWGYLSRDGLDVTVYNRLVPIGHRPV